MTAERLVPRAYRVAPPRRVVASDAKTGWRAIAVIVLLFDLGLASWLWITDPRQWPVGVAIAVIPVLLIVTLPVFVWAARSESRFDLAGLLATGLLLRFAASFYRFSGATDATVYHNVGSNLAASFRNLDFAVDVKGRLPGTGGMNLIGGVAEVVTNGNEFATFLLFTWLSFTGCFLLYRAFVTALPDADHRRYALLILLWPTMVYWPSSLGKDSWMVFTLGLGALGAARILMRRPGGYVLLAIGTLLGSLVRPHVVLLELVAFGLAFLIGRQPIRSGTITPSSVGKVAGLVVLLVLGGVLVQRFETLAGSADLTDVDSVLAINANRTDQGGSAFHASDPTNPVGYAVATVTVLFRPFPNETGGLEQTAAALEAFFLLLLFLASWRRLITIPGRLRAEPYVTLALFYLLMFIFGFATIANFGILARQRSQVLPFVFVLLSVTATTRRSRAPATQSARARSPRLDHRVVVGR